MFSFFKLLSPFISNFETIPYFKDTIMLVVISEKLQDAEHREKSSRWLFHWYLLVCADAQFVLLNQSPQALLSLRGR